MFREMRRFKQQLSKEECDDVLYRNTSGVLAVLGDEDYPYSVPLSYVYKGDKIYFHSAKTGHKLDAIEKNSKVSFCIIDKDTVVPEKYTTYFRSVIVFGKARILSNPLDILEVLEVLAEKYSPDQIDGRKQEITQQISHVSIIELNIEFLSGKEAIELKNERNN